MFYFVVLLVCVAFPDAVDGGGDFRGEDVNRDVGATESQGDVAVHRRYHGSAITVSQLAESVEWAQVGHSLLGVVLELALLDRHLGVILEVMRTVHMLKRRAIHRANSLPISLRPLKDFGGRLLYRSSGISTPWVLRPCNNDPLALRRWNSIPLTDPFDLILGYDIILGDHRDVISPRLWRFGHNRLALSQKSIYAPGRMRSVEARQQSPNFRIVKVVLGMCHLKPIDML